MSVGPVHSEEVWSAQQWEEERASQSLPDPTETTDQQRPQESHHRRPAHAGSQRDLLRGVCVCVCVYTEHTTNYTTIHNINVYMHYIHIIYTTIYTI